MARTRQVFDYETVAHLWAEQNHTTTPQGSARSPGNPARMYYEDETIYSYGPHFPIARIKGDVILFTAQGHSVTTERHKRIVWNAAHRFYDQVFTVQTTRANCYADHTLNLKHLVEDAIGFYRKSLTARVHREHFVRLGGQAAFKAHQYAARFELQTPVLSSDPRAAVLAFDILNHGGK